MSEEIYEALCVGCPHEKSCHDNSEVCDKVLILEMKEEELEEERKK